jgi:hypothetical protein
MPFVLSAILALVYATLIEKNVEQRNVSWISEYLDDEQRNSLASLLLGDLTLVTKVLQTNLNGFADVILKSALESGNSEAVEIAFKHGARSDDSNIAPDLFRCISCLGYSHSSKLFQCQGCVDGKVCSTCIDDSRMTDAPLEACPICKNSILPMNHENLPLHEIAIFECLRENIRNPEFTWVETVGELYSLALD